MKIIEFLKGKKTYILAICGGIVMALWYAGIIEDKARDMLLGLLGFGGMATMRAGVQKKILGIFLVCLCFASMGCSSKFLGADQDITMYAANIKVKAVQGQPLTVNLKVPLGDPAAGALATAEGGIETTFNNVDEFESRGTGYRIVNRGKAHNVQLQGYGDYTVQAAQGDVPNGSEQDGAHMILFNLRTEDSNTFSNCFKKSTGWTLAPWEVKKPVQDTPTLTDNATIKQLQLKLDDR